MTVSLKITLQHFHVHKQLYLTTYYIQQIHITKNKANSSLKVYYETRKDYKNVYIINKIKHMLEFHIKDVSIVKWTDQKYWYIVFEGVLSGTLIIKIMIKEHIPSICFIKL